jgi:S-phase kinase-associated protein 1
MENGATSKMITLRTSDGEEIKVSEAVAMQSKLIRHMIEDDCAQDVIPLPNVTSKILAKVIEYCKRQADAADASEASEEGSSTAWVPYKISDEDQRDWEKQF